MNIGVKSDRWDAPFEKAPEGVIREEIFSVERLESRAQALAQQHSRTTSPRSGRSLAPLIRESGRVLERCRRQLDATVTRGVLVPPAGRWLLDNFHLVSGLGKAINRDLPSAYYRELPKLGPGELGGYPRIYGLARKWAAHCDSHFESEIFRRFVAAYQGVLPLTLGELWALSITLRIVLLENLRHQIENVVVSLRDTERADRLADLLLGLGKGPVLDPAVVPARFKNRPLRSISRSRI
jgi:cyclic beta-1,2-glucan synthetase